MTVAIIRSKMFSKLEGQAGLFYIMLSPREATVREDSHFGTKNQNFIAAFLTSQKRI